LFTKAALIPRHCIQSRWSIVSVRSNFVCFVEVILRLTVSQAVRLGVEPAPKLASSYYFLLEACCLKVVVLFQWGTLWREDGSAVCSEVTQWSESSRTSNRTLQSHLDSSNLEGQVPVFISSRNRAAQLYLRALCFLYVAPCDS
jgi:hypothetical protein